MKVIDDMFPSSRECVALSKLTVEYAQDLDCCQSEDDHFDGCQILTVTTDDGGGGKFIRFNTGEAGWSINDIEELVDILKDFKQRLNCES